ncbi:enoyl-CoA hydratase/isomerase family protein [Pseudonocardia kunmingensis]|uniref:2-(1,2-epoxy-1,2-dihydrophenyl)acetyl-CoA isomerase n=1 Tax=Pseudonocardia kunmingensis TaxID=630975 RepID=A0A543D0F4_9PSEU|nr:enoyl-CoA hydratase-related protein [Pseudonocardia kunmingensis]TQM02807.1 2-(1,2-epoxy-1,2-dihydrophenyl)acetyl-CoA isomerase [Pseudonocardia kunmingensis]
MSDEAVLTGLRENVLTVTLNRPAVKNAMTPASWAALFDVFRDAGSDDEVRAVVIEGAGDAFCSGADISASAPGHPLTRVRTIGRTAEEVCTLPKPVIAKVRGVAVGAGLGLALCADFVVATPGARFSAIFARRALSLDFGSSWLLTRVMGLQQAKRLAYLGEIIGADRARELGIVTEIVDDDEIDAHVDDLAGRLAAMPPIAVAQNKELLHAGLGSSLRDAIDGEARAQAVNYGTADLAAARRAFTAKTAATYTGEWGG